MKRSLLVLVFALIVVSISATTIYDIQYTTVAGPDGTYPSTYEDQEITVTGIVSGVKFSGFKDNFYIEMADGGAWSGVYVFMAGDTTLVAGDEVEITGTVREYYGLTEISGYDDTFISVTLLSSGNPIPAPIVVQTADLVDPVDAEQYEGCLVEINDVVVTEEQINFGQWYVTDVSANPCQIDDGFFYLDSVTPPIVITLGMEWAIIRGCLDYSYDEYGIHPRTPDDLIDEVSAPNNSLTSVSEFVGCYPNPFNPETTAYFNLAQDCMLELSVYNIKGERVRTLINEELSAGEHRILWNGKDDQDKSVSSGIYFMFAESANGEYTSVKKVILMK